MTGNTRTAPQTRGQSAGGWSAGPVQDDGCGEGLLHGPLLSCQRLQHGQLAWKMFLGTRDPRNGGVLGVIPFSLTKTAISDPVSPSPHK